MKKVLLGLLTFVLAFSVLLDTTLASTDETKIKESYDKVATYYKQSGSVLYSADDVIAISSLDLPVNEFTLFEDVLKQDFTKMPAGTLSKNIIAFSLMGIDPKNVNGANLVEILESYVKEDGSISVSETEIAAPNYAVWCLYALISVDSNSVNKVADFLASQQLDTGAFWYEYMGQIADESTTGWVIETLSIVDKMKYKDVIEKAIAYLNGVQQSDGSWGAWGASADTQAAVLQGLLAYDLQGVKNGAYDKDGISPYDTLLSFQSTEEGWFGYNDYFSGNFTFSEMTTYNSAISLGSYFNGSFVYKAKAAYQALSTVVTPELTPEGEVELEENNTVIEGVATNDTSNFITWISLLAFSFIVIVMVRGYEQN